MRSDSELSVKMEYQQWHELESCYLRYLAEEIDRPLLIANMCNLVPGGRTKLQALVASVREHSQHSLRIQPQPQKDRQPESVGLGR